MKTRYQSETEIAAVVRGFESCQTDKASFRHSDHLTVAVWYLQTLDTQAAVDRMRSSLLRFVDHHGVDRRKYNETVTVFWIEIAAKELEHMPAEATLVEKCNRVLEALCDKQLVDEYYSPEILNSTRARELFVAPDLKNW